MSTTAALLAMVLATCEWAAEPLPPIQVLEPPAYEQAARSRGLFGPTWGFAEWERGSDPPRGCKITMQAPTTARRLCHELLHCERGYWHRLHLRWSDGRVVADPVEEETK